MFNNFSVSPFREAYLAATRTLGGTAEMAGGMFDAVIACGTQPTRRFHDAGHFIDVASAANPEHALWRALEERRLDGSSAKVAALLRRAGAHHDIVYFEIDGKIPDALRPVLAPYVDGDAALKPFSAMSEEQGELLRRALIVFGRDHAAPFDAPGSNEFLSALAAGAAGEACGIAPRHVLCEMAMIEATIPFRPKKCMTKLSDRLREADLTLPVPERASEGEKRATMLGAVQLANHDVIGFRGAYATFHSQSDRLLEERGFLQETPAERRAAAAKQQESMRRLREVALLGEIFHGHDGYPSQPILDHWNSNAWNNIETRLRDCQRESFGDDSGAGTGTLR